MTNDRIEFKLVKNSSGITYRAEVYIDGKREQIIESQNRMTVGRVVAKEYPGMTHIFKK